MKRGKGFTLIELIVTLSVLSIILLSLFPFVGSSIKIFNRCSLKASREQIALTILYRITSDIRSADSLAAESNTNLLSLKTGEDNIKFSFANGKVQRIKNNSIAYLTDSSDINSLSFAYPSPQMVNIKLDTFSTKISLRN